MAVPLGNRCGECGVWLRFTIGSKILARDRRMRRTTGDDGYRPGNDEPFMNPRQLEYFREKLLRWKDAIYREAAGTLSQLQTDRLREADLTDRASSETDWSIELRTRDRQRKLISKIDAALRRIEKANTVIAKSPASRSASPGWKRGRSPR